ncbi:MAG: diacylglycerol/lipid kinase family protein [Bacteroidota bacterium]
MKKSIRFIINPRSGTSEKKELPELIRSVIDRDRFDTDIRFTERAGHAALLAEESVSSGTDIVAVAGGDGSVNEVTGPLLHSKSALAILPFGSGNGLARHLSIPLETKRALELINSGEGKMIDAFIAGSHVGIGTFGLGFDAHVAHLFAQSKTRGYSTYVKLVLGEFIRYKPISLHITLKGESKTVSPFLFTVANSSQFGNNAVIAPGADISDGLLDIATVNPFPIYAAPGLIYRLISNKLQFSGYYSRYLADEISFSNYETIKAHIDGEPVEIQGDFSVKIIPGSIRIIVPSCR